MPRLKKKEPVKNGRPTKYNKTFHPPLIKALAAQGLSDLELSDELGITRATFYNWCNKYSDFMDAKKKGKEDPDNAIESALFDKARGGKTLIKQKLDRFGEVRDLEEEQPADTTAMIFWLKNRRPERWRDKQQVEHSGKMDIEGTMSLSPEDETRIVAQLEGLINPSK